MYIQKQELLQLHNQLDEPAESEPFSIIRSHAFDSVFNQQSNSCYTMNAIRDPTIHRIKDLGFLYSRVLLIKDI